jgi:hypothetical protein
MTLVLQRRRQGRPEGAFQRGAKELFSHFLKSPSALTDRNAALATTMSKSPTQIANYLRLLRELKMIEVRTHRSRGPNGAWFNHRKITIVSREN